MLVATKLHDCKKLLNFTLHNLLIKFTLFQVVGDQFDKSQEGGETKYYETMYALLDSVSPGYSQAFGKALVRKLASLPGNVDEESSEIPDKPTDKTHPVSS